jgi:hypothetical protein
MTKSQHEQSGTNVRKLPLDFLSLYRRCILNVWLHVRTRRHGPLPAVDSLHSVVSDEDAIAVNEKAFGTPNRHFVGVGRLRRRGPFFSVRV